MDEVGNVEYVMLSNKQCNSGAGANGASNLTWKFPYIKPQESPIMYIQAVQVHFYAGDAAGSTTPFQVRLVSTLAENYYADDKQFPIFSLLISDAAADNFKNPENNPLLQVSTINSYITFNIETQLDNVVVTNAADATISILLKIVRPKQMMLTENNIATYAKRLL